MDFLALRYIAEHIKETASTHARQTKVNARRLGLNAKKPKFRLSENEFIFFDGKRMLFRFLVFSLKSV